MWTGASNLYPICRVRWRQPSLTVSAVETSNESSSYSIIPSSASAKISVRYVPRQKPDEVQAALEAHLQHEFKKLNTPNTVGEGGNVETMARSFVVWVYHTVGTPVRAVEPLVARRHYRAVLRRRQPRH